MSHSPSPEHIREQLDHITHSSAIGRSGNYKELLRYLVECELANIEQGSSSNTPKEFDIASSIFPKKQGYAPGEDSSVRVYVSNLRKKLKDYYSSLNTAPPFCIEIPKGGYRVVFAAPPAKANTKEHSKPRMPLSYALAALLLISIAINGIQWFTDHKQAEPALESALQSHPLWARFNQNDKPVLLVMGDLYIFSEFDPLLKRYRTIRDVSINSPQDYNDFITQHPERLKGLKENRANFVTKANVLVTRMLIPALATDKETTFKLQSQLTASDLRDFNIIFVGLFKALGPLNNYLNGSNFTLNDSRYLIRHKQSDAQYPVKGNFQQQFTDYGLFASFQSPGGNHIMIISGFSDTSIIQIGKTLTSEHGLNTLRQAAQHSNTSLEAGFEALFEVSGYDRTALSGDVLLTLPVNEQAIWAKPE